MAETTSGGAAAPETPAVQGAPQVVSDGGKQMALVIYILYFVGFFVGLTAIAGVIIAHLKVGEASETFRSHFSYQIRTFWFGFLMLFIGAVTAIFFVGYLVFLWWGVWTLIRCIKGILRVNENRPIDNPKTLLW